MVWFPLAAPSFSRPPSVPSQIRFAGHQTPDTGHQTTHDSHPPGRRPASQHRPPSNPALLWSQGTEDVWESESESDRHQRPEAREANRQGEPGQVSRGLQVHAPKVPCARQTVGKRWRPNTGASVSLLTTPADDTRPENAHETPPAEGRQLGTAVAVGAVGHSLVTLVL